MTSRRRSFRSIVNARRGFSLAELMIALAILGFGLLVVGATLPIGIMKHRETIELAMGDAAVADALDAVEARVRLSRGEGLIDAGVPNFRESFFCPRDGSFQPIANHEPWIKVRPLVVENVYAAGSRAGSAPGRGSILVNLWRGYSVTDLVEEQIEQYVEAFAIAASPFSVVGGSSEYLQDGVRYEERTATNPWDPVEGALPPVLSVLDCVYPSVSPDFVEPANDNQPFTPHWFAYDPTRLYNRYQTRTWDGPNSASAGFGRGSETDKALDRNVCWVAFYRRVSYAAGADESVYEIIVVAVRRTTSDHRFPLLDIYNEYGSASNPARPRFASLDDPENCSLIPIPLLVALMDVSGNSGVPWAVDANHSPSPAPPSLAGRVTYTTQYGLADPIPRIPTTAVAPPTLQFKCTREVGELLPPGSVFIPAANDEALSGSSGVQLSGFVPEAPENLPIFKVLSRDFSIDAAECLLTVENNGFYPWINAQALSNDPERAMAWPVWVIPPAFKETIVDPDLGYRVPLFEKRSPILAVGRRLIRVREVP